MAAADAVAVVSPVYCKVREGNLMVNMLVVNQVIPSVLQLCLEYGVNNRSVDPDTKIFVHEDATNPEWFDNVNKTIWDFVEKEKDSRPNGWYKKNGSKYQMSYKKLDTTNLMEIITKVTDINQESKHKNMKDLFDTLKDIKDFRNKVTHENEFFFSADTMDPISDKVNVIVDQLAGIFEISPNQVDTFKKRFQIQIEEIKRKNCPETNEDMLYYHMKHILLEEVPVVCGQLAMEAIHQTTETIQEVIDEVSEEVSEKCEVVVETITHVKETIQEVIDEVSEEVSEKCEVVVETITHVKETILEAIDEVSEEVSDKCEVVVETITHVKETILEAIDEVSEEVPEKCQVVFESINLIKGTILEAIDDVIDEYF